MLSLCFSLLWHDIVMWMWSLEEFLIYFYLSRQDLSEFAWCVMWLELNNSLAKTWILDY